MKLFSNLASSQTSGYSQLNEVKTDGPLNLMARVQTTCASLFRTTRKIADYGFLPMVSLLHFDFIYRFYLHYLVAVSVVFLLIGNLFKLQDRLLYHPEVPPNSSLYVPFPTHVPFETVQLTTSDGEKLKGFFVKSPNGDASHAPTIIYFHGNAGNAGSPCALPMATICGTNILIVDYRGYGRSTGNPSEDGLYLDGVACVEYVSSRNDVDPNKIVLFGHSMGGAVAIHLASKMHESEYRIAALIVENTFTTLPHAAKHIFRGLIPGLSKLPLCCHSNKFLSIEKIASVTVPILFICGEKDEIVDPQMTLALRNASDNPHTIMMRVPNGTHNDTWCVSKNYHRFISAFLAKVFNEAMADHDPSSQSIPEFMHNDLLNHSVMLTWKCEIVAQ